MRNPLVEVVERELSKLGMSNAKLVHESYSPQNFGNAEAIYELGKLQLRFLRDRGDDTVSIGSSSSPQHFYNIEDVAVWMGWIALADLLKYDTPINFDEPPPGPIFSLPKALSLIARDLKQLDRAFSSGEIMSTHAKLKETERKRLSAT
ncbi:MAG: hypothetical protein MN733_05825 [Nitrososphaera sp.]|nr:hypothetical protein [Nitrososphaera sp.]